MAEEAKEQPKEQAKEGSKNQTKKQPEGQSKPEAKKPAAVEKPTNCAKCNKRLQRKTWYYRDGAYFCGKRCWRLAVKAISKKKGA